VSDVLGLIDFLPAGGFRGFELTAHAIGASIQLHHSSILEGVINDI
jgi:hypothetical protein